jgi:hypothetical protein
VKNFKEELAKSREVALYAHLSHHTWFAVFEVSYSEFDECSRPLDEGQRREITMDSYVRISEPVKINFTGIDNETMVRNAVEALNAEERKLIDEMNKKLADLREQKNQLMALTYQGAS